MAFGLRKESLIQSEIPQESESYTASASSAVRLGVRASDRTISGIDITSFLDKGIDSKGQRVWPGRGQGGLPVTLDDDIQQAADIAGQGGYFGQPFFRSFPVQEQARQRQLNQAARQLAGAFQHKIAPAI